MKKYLFLLLALGFVLFVSCDGQDRIGKTNTEILKENKLLDSFSEKIEYIPERYSEVVTDTILSNGFRIKTKASIDMINSILKTSNIDSIQKKTFYRNRTVEITVEKDGKQIFSEVINNDFFIKHSKNLDHSFKDYIYDEGHTTYDDSFVKDKVTFIIFYKNHLTGKSKSFDIIVHETGIYEVVGNRISHEDIF